MVYFATVSPNAYCNAPLSHDPQAISCKQLCERCALTKTIIDFIYKKKIADTMCTESIGQAVAVVVAVTASGCFRR